MLFAKSCLTVFAALPVALLVACSGGGGGDDDGSSSLGTNGSSGGGGNTPRGSASNTGALTDDVSGIPVAGEFLATCLESGVALIDSFVSASPLPLEDAPLASDVLEMADPDLVPVIGGLQPTGLLGELAPIDVDQTLSLIPLSGLPADLPVIGIAPVSCSTVPTALEDLPEPTDAIGLIPVFDASGNPVALLLATAGQTSGSTPVLTDVTLPGTEEVLPTTLVSAVEPLVSSLLSPLGL